MPRVIGIDPGTISVDLCGLDNGRVFLDTALPTPDTLADPEAFIARLEAAGPVDLIAGPSGYGLPCIRAGSLTETDLRLACLAVPGESGGIRGLLTLLRALARSRLPVVLTPGVIHLDSVPAYRKINRVDMGTADKVCAAALAIREQAERRGCSIAETAFILLELGGAFSAAIAVEGGRIVDGMGGSSGPIGLRAPGALDGEVAFLAGRVSKSMIFEGGAAAVAGEHEPEALARSTTARAHDSWDAYLEGAAKAVASLRVSAPGAVEVILSGRASRLPGVRERLARLIARGPSAMSVEFLAGFAATAQAAQGAALVADGLAGGLAAELVESLGIREARGTVLDHLHVVSREQANARLGIAPGMAPGVA